MRDKRTLSHAPLGGLDALGLRTEDTQNREGGRRSVVVGNCGRKKRGQGENELPARALYEREGGREREGG